MSGGAQLFWSWLGSTRVETPDVFDKYTILTILALDWYLSYIGLFFYLSSIYLLELLLFDLYFGSFLLCLLRYIVETRKLLVTAL